MDENSKKRADIYKIDPRSIIIKEGFNSRRHFDIEELKEQIKLQGVLNPITVIPIKVNGDEKYQLVDGERRLRATLKAIEEGSDIKRIPAIFKPKNSKEEDLYVEQMMRNEGKQFTEYECGIMFNKFQDKFGYNQIEIANKFCKSASFVSQCLSLLDLPVEIQKSLENNEITTSAVRTIIKNSGNEEDNIELVQKTVQSAKQQNKSIATAKDIDESQKEKRKSDKLQKTLLSIKDKMSGCDLINISDLCNFLDEHKNIDKAIEEYIAKNNI